jgi:hypothetical protein
MNPLRWKHEHQVAWLVICVIGGIIGLLSAFFTENHAFYTRIFFSWLPEIYLYWPWPVFGAVIPGLAFYVYQLLRISN